MDTIYKCDACSMGICFHISVNGGPKNCPHNDLMSPVWLKSRSIDNQNKYVCYFCGTRKKLYHPGGYLCPNCEIEHGISKKQGVTFLYNGEKYRPPKQLI